MSRRESDREDLLREATALVERVELKVAGWDEPVVIGFRQDGSLSLFFGAEPVYQFNAAGELRRAFCGGLLYKAERGGLVSLRRERCESEVVLVRNELTNQQSDGFLQDCRGRLKALAAALDQRGFTVTGQIPSDGNVIFRVQEWLTVLPAQIRVARTAGLHSVKRLPDTQT